jgi:hypothetical protein
MLLFRNALALSIFASLSCSRRELSTPIDAGQTLVLLGAASGPPAEPGHATIAPSPSAVAARSTASAPTRTLPASDAPASSSLAVLGRISEPPSNDEGPAVVFALPRVKGGLLTDVAPAVKRLRGGVRACYERFLGEEDDPPAASDLSLHLFVMQNGSVQSAKAEDVSHLSASAVDCIVRRAQVATFPPPVGEPSEVIVSIHLHP